MMKINFRTLKCRASQTWKQGSHWYVVCPTTNSGMQNGSSGSKYTLHSTHFCTFGVDLYAQSALLTKFLHQSSVWSLLKVHYWFGSHAWEGQGQPEHLGVLKEVWYSRGEKSWIEKDGDLCQQRSVCVKSLFSAFWKKNANKYLLFS